MAVSRAFGIVAWERLAGAFAIGAVVAVGAPLSGLAVLVLVDLVLVAMLALEHVRIER